MDAEEKKRIVYEAAVEMEGKRKLSCAKAFAISGEHGIAVREIGEICNECGIKIHGCQLGCFK
jgi:hypothetical protein